MSDEEYLNELHGRVHNPHTLNLSGRQTRHVGIRFTDDQARRAKEINEATRHSLDELLKAQGDISYVQGVKAAVGAITVLIDSSEINLQWDRESIQVWLAHVVATRGACGCDIERDWEDQSTEVTFCADYEDRDYRRLWYLGYFGLTEVELQAQELEAQRKRAEEKAREEALRKEYRREQFLRMCKEFGVDPKLLP